MSDSRSKRQRDRARQLERERAWAERQRTLQRRRAIIGVFGVLLIVAVVVGIVIAAGKGKDTVATSATTTSVDPLAELRRSTTTSSLPSGPPASLPTVAPGQTVTGAVPCPNPDGSSPRTTSFSQPPPLCIDPNTTYDADVMTSAGPMKFLLDPKEATQTVNAFVVLARYHYWDGAPLTKILPNVVFQAGPVGKGPGFTIPNETPPQGTIFPVGRIAMVADSGANQTVDPGIFQVALGEEAAGLPKNTPAFGILLDAGGPDLGVLQTIRKAGSADGAPTGVVTIQSITITASPVSTPGSTPG